MNQTMSFEPDAMAKSDGIGPKINLKNVYIFMAMCSFLHAKHELYLHQCYCLRLNMSSLDKAYHVKFWLLKYRINSVHVKNPLWHIDTRGSSEGTFKHSIHSAVDLLGLRELS